MTYTKPFELTTVINNYLTININKVRNGPYY